MHICVETDNNMENTIAHLQCHELTYVSYKHISMMNMQNTIDTQRGHCILAIDALNNLTQIDMSESQYISFIEEQVTIYTILYRMHPIPTSLHLLDFKLDLLAIRGKYLEENEKHTPQTPFNIGILNTNSWTLLTKIIIKFTKAIRKSYIKNLYRTNEKSPQVLIANYDIMKQNMAMYQECKCPHAHRTQENYPTTWRTYSPFAVEISPSIPYTPLQSSENQRHCQPILTYKKSQT